MIDATSTPHSFPESSPPSLAVRLKRAAAPLAGTIKSVAATRVGWRASGLVRPRGVIVLMYHRIGTMEDRFPGLDVEIFREHVEWLARNCSPIGPDELRTAVTTRPKGRPFVLITFDDGYLSYRQHAYPILRKQGVPALVFLATGYIDEPTRLFWWDKLRLAVEDSPKSAIELPWAERQSVSLDGAVARAQLLARAKAHLKNQEEGARERALAELLALLDSPLDAKSYGKQMMDWHDVRAVQDVTRLGGHTHDHPIMSSIAEARVETEVARCRERIRAETGLEPPWFAYPNGRRRDFDEHSRAALLRHGFDCAFSTEEGLVGPDPDWLALRRLPGDKPLRDLAWQIVSCPRH